MGIHRLYQYEPLPRPTCRYLTASGPGQPEERQYEVPHTTCIRLATLEPATHPRDELVIRLDIVPFKAPPNDSDYGDPNLAIWHDVRTISGDDPPLPKYEALSYAWGSEVDLGRVRVRSRGHKHAPDSYYLPITQNLDGALRALRRYHVTAENANGTRESSLSRVLWIDAICIDQANAAEKGPQVAMMGSIYQSASRVVAWLGPADQTSHRAMRFMCSIGLQVNVSFRGSELSGAPGASDPTLGDMQVPLFESHDDEMVPCLIALFERAWFSRLWVVQEILLGNPSRTVVLCGPQDAVPWSIFRKAMAVVSWKWPEWPFTQENRHGVMRMLWTFVTVQDTTAYLSRLRQDFGALACKDPRDRIFAVMNLLGPFERRYLCIRPDYEKPFTKLYRELVRRSIGILGDLTILEECEGATDEHSWLPSWVPNWAGQPGFHGPKSALSFASSQLAGWNGSQNDILDDSSDILTLAGVSVSTIQHIEAHHPNDIHDSSQSRIDCMLLQGELRDPERPWGVPLCEWVRTLLTGEVAEVLSPPPQWAATMEEGMDTLRTILSTGAHTPDESAIEEASRQSRSVSHRFITNVRTRLDGRRMCKDSRGSLVLAPKSTRPGDSVCVLLGSDNQVLLRRTSPNSEHFHLVGTCFAHCALYGAAVLGPLPHGIRLVFHPRTSKPAFISVKTGQRSVVDPRLSCLLGASKLKELEKTLSLNEDSPVRIPTRIDPEVLSKCGIGLDGRKGVDMQGFKII